jgi:GTP:adenosylcobinamide-phosphate guanylyltransferase
LKGQRPTVAILLAGGKSIHGSQDNKGPLSLWKSRPLFNYTLEALQSSLVDRVFVVGDPGMNLKQSTSPNPKNVFISNDSSRGIVSNITYAIAEVKKYYGVGRFRDLNIILVPCDLPYVSSDSFNQVINNTDDDNTITIPLIKTTTLAKAAPKRRIWSIFFKDLGGYYTPQSVITLNCSKIITDIDQSPRLEIEHSPDPNDLRGLLSAVDQAFNTRKKSYNKIHIGVLALILSARKGRLIKSIELVTKNWFRRLSTSQLLQHLEELTSATIGLEPLEELELSLDVDTQEQLDEITNNSI